MVPLTAEPFQMEYVIGCVGIWLCWSILCPQALGKTEVRSFRFKKREVLLLFFASQGLRSQEDYAFVLRDSGARLVIGPKSGPREAMSACSAAGTPYISIALETSKGMNDAY